MRKQSEIEAEINRIAALHDGRLTPEQIVEIARDPASVLHNEFTWDDAEAAIKRRLDEARSLIRSVTIVVTNRELTFSVPAYLRDPEKPAREQGYIQIGRLKTDADFAREAAVREFARAREALSRAQAVAAFLDLGSELAEATALVEALVSRAQAETRTEGNA